MKPDDERLARLQHHSAGRGHSGEADTSSSVTAPERPLASPDLAAPERRVVGGEIAVRDAETHLQFDGIARGERHHGLQPDGGGERDVGGGDFAEGAADFGRAVQHEPPAHACGGAGVDLVEQRRPEEVGAVGGGNEVVVGDVEGALIVVVGVVQADLRPGPDADVVVVVGVCLEARQPARASAWIS